MPWGSFIMRTTCVTSKMLGWPAQYRGVRLREGILFNAVGFEACTIEDITERADVGKGTFYRHFEDKYAIITTLVESSLAELRRQLRAPREAVQQPQDAILHLFDTHAGFFMAHPDAAFMLFQGRMQLRFRRGQADGLDQAFQSYFTDLEQCLAPHLAGPRDPPRVRAIACAAAGGIWGFLSAASIGMKKEEIGPALASMRPSYLAGLRDLLKGTRSELHSFGRAVRARTKADAHSARMARGKAMQGPWNRIQRAKT